MKRADLMFSLFFVFIILNSSSSQSLRQLLNELYDQTGGPNWNRSNGWPLNDTITNPCNFKIYGILCANQTTPLGTFEVVAIDLHDNNLIGSLPSGILSYPFLYYFTVNSNQLVGKIPTVTSFALAWGDFSSNSFEGEISNNFKGLGFLGHLDVSSNQLSGSLPTGIWTKTLRSVSFSNNQFAGEIPSQIGDSQDLQIFSAFSNSLTGNLPQEICSIPSLILLVANGNKFTGEIPQCLFNSSSLRTIHLDDNQFTGDISILSLLTPDSPINVINLSKNKLTGTIPNELTELKNLTQLRLSNNNIGGTIPVGFGSLKTFHVLDLSYNQLTGGIPKDILNGPTMQVILLNNNLLNGSVADIILDKAINYYIQQIDISYNNLTGEMNWGVFIVLPNLEKLKLNNNQLSGNGIPTLPNIIRSIEKLSQGLVSFGGSYDFVPSELVIGIVEGISVGTPALKELDLSNNDLGGGISAMFFRLFPYLVSYKTSNNRMTGSVPGEIVFCFKLQEFDVSNNLHTGSIPNLSQLPEIKYFRAQNNRFTGRFPELKGLPSLEELNLSNNQVQIDSKSFASLFQLPKLTDLNLANNIISGQIPIITGQPATVNLDLSNCGLIGSIDSSFYNLRLQSLNLSRNNLTGSISAFHSDPISLDLSSNNFNAGIEFIYGLASIRYLNVSRNQFSGSIPDISGQKSLIYVDLSHNLLIGRPPSFLASDFQNMLTIDLSNNQLEGALVVSMAESVTLEYVDFSGNRLNNASIFAIPNNTNCNLMGNQFACPVGIDAFSCGALSSDYPCKPADADATASMTLIVQGSSSAFDSNSFIASLSKSINVTASRFSVVKVFSSSFSVGRKRNENTQVDFNVSPPAKGSYEGSASQVVTDIVNHLRSNPSSIAGFTVLAAYEEIQRPPNTLSKGGIAGIVIGCIVFVMIVAALVAFFLWRRNVKRKRREMLELQAMQNSTLNDLLLDNVEVKETIGSGNFGEVYIGNWNGTRVALKSAIGDTNSEKWKQEILLLKGLNHPNIVRMLGVHRFEDKLYVVLEYAANGSLDVFLHNKENADKMSNNNLLEMCFDLTQAMAYLQAKKILHRDLAARNLLVDASYHVKVSDFGLSKTNETYERESTPIPVKWSAPETIEKGISSTASDVWSFAVCLWEIYTFCNTPYHNLTNSQVLPELKKGFRLPKPEKCPDKIYMLMLDCWEMNPTGRPDFNQIHARMLESNPGVLHVTSGFKVEQGIYVQEEFKYHNNSNGKEEVNNNYQTKF